MRLIGFLALVVLFLIVHEHGWAGYLKDWRKTRIVVELSEPAATKLGAVRELLNRQAREILAQDPVGPTVTGQSHGYLYLRLIADIGPAQQYFGVLDVRVVRPVVVVPIGKVAVAAIWEEAIALSGPVGDFTADVRAALGKALAKLKEDWRKDNAFSP